MHDDDDDGNSAYYIRHAYKISDDVINTTARPVPLTRYTECGDSGMNLAVVKVTERPALILCTTI